MRRRSVEAVLGALALAGVCGTGALAACSSSSSPGTPPDAATDGNASPGPPDAGDASPGDATLGTDTGSPAADAGADADANATDAAADSAQPDVNAPPLNFNFDGGADCGVGPRGEPTELSCTGLYSDFAAKTVTPGIVQYDPGLTFWSDGAQKTRWLSLPPGTQIDTTDMDEWVFPIGTRIWKEFRLPDGDGGAETRVETRLLWKIDHLTWYRTTYVWTPDGETSATELTSGEFDAGGSTYEIPSQQKCNQCHHGRKDGVLGIEAVSLSSPLASGLTLQSLGDAGLLTAPPTAPYVIPGDPTQAAALAWLHSNCGTACHNEGYGQAENTGFWMRLDVAKLASVEATDTYTTGWNRPTTAFPIPGVTGTSYRLHACDTSSSCAYYRAGHRDGVDGTPSGTQMPPIDTHIVDGVDLAGLGAWIDEGCADAGHD
jgi:hypothetical protein